MALDRAPSLRDHPAFARYWTALTISGFGSAITQVALQLLIVTTMGLGSDATGLVNGARWLPYLVLGLVAGVLVDRMRRRPVMVVADFVRGLLLILIPVLAVTGNLSLAALAIFMVIFGLLSLLHDAADMAFLPRLLPRALVPAAHARLDQAGAVIQASGPALAGLLVRLLSAPLAVLVDAVTYIVSGFLILATPAPEPPGRRGTLAEVKSEALDGVRFVYRHRMLAPKAINTHAWFLFNAAAGAVITPFAVRTLGFDALVFGLALAMAGVGALVGALFAVRLGTRYGAGWTIIGCRALNAIGLAVVALSPTQGAAGWLVFGAGQLIIGLSMGASNANEMGYQQIVTPDEMQGRMNAINRSTNRAMIVIGAPVGGIVGELIGYRELLWVSTCGFAVVAVALALTPFRTAKLSADDVSQP
jgi:MFS family permease